MFKIKDKCEYGLFILETEKRKLENMIELRLDKGEEEKNKRFIKKYKEQIDSIDHTIKQVKKGDEIK